MVERRTPNSLAEVRFLPSSAVKGTGRRGGAGCVAEWTKAAAWNAAGESPRGFESHRTLSEGGQRERNGMGRSRADGVVPGVRGRVDQGAGFEIRRGFAPRGFESHRTLEEKPWGSLVEKARWRRGYVAERPKAFAC